MNNETRAWVVWSGWTGPPALYSIPCKVTAKRVTLPSNSGAPFGWAHTIPLDAYDATPEAAIERWRDRLRVRRASLAEQIASVDTELANTPQEVPRG